MFTNSLFLELKNKFLAYVQNSAAAEFVRDSVFFQNLDWLILGFFVLTILSTAFLGSGAIGFFALIFCALNALRLLFKRGETVKISKLDCVLIIYFLFIFLSLMGSTLFVLSFKGFLKSVIYLLFYFGAVYFFLNNKSKILPTLGIVALIMSYESFIAIFQHFNRVEALAGWVDMSNITNDKEIISRSFGTLRPSNPNLLGGYLIAGLSSVFACAVSCFLKGKKTHGLIFGGLFLVNLIAIIFTGCRGAYIGLIGFFGALGWAVDFCIRKYLGGYSNIKKRYKNLAIGAFALCILAVILTPSISKRFLSIFQFRGDSSISFRMNVYEAAMQMFLDNPFLGIGLGNLNFREIYGLYMKTGFDALGSYCVPLEVAVESGIFALLAFLWFIALALVLGFKMFKNDETKEGVKVVIYAVILTIVATMAHGLFDTVWYRPQVQIIFWTNIAILNSLVLKDCNSVQK